MAFASAELWTLTVLAHSIAGGGLPSLPGWSAWPGW